MVSTRSKASMSPTLHLASASRISVWVAIKGRKSWNRCPCIGLKLGEVFFAFSSRFRFFFGRSSSCSESGLGAKLAGGEGESVGRYSGGRTGGELSRTYL